LSRLASVGADGRRGGGLGLTNKQEHIQEQIIQDDDAKRKQEGHKIENISTNNLIPHFQNVFTGILHGGKEQ